MAHISGKFDPSRFGPAVLAKAKEGYNHIVQFPWEARTENNETSFFPEVEAYISDSGVDAQFISVGAGLSIDVVMFRSAADARTFCDWAGEVLAEGWIKGNVRHETLLEDHTASNCISAPVENNHPAL